MVNKKRMCSKVAWIEDGCDGKDLSGQIECSLKYKHRGLHYDEVANIWWQHGVE